MSDAVLATGILVRRSPAAVRVVSSSVAAASVITTAEPHGMESGESTTISGHTGSTPALAGPYIITKLTETTFSIPVNVTVAGTGGTSTPVENYVTVGEIVTVTPPGYSRNKLEVSNQNANSEASLLGLLRSKDPSFRINYLGGDTTHAEILRDILNNTKANWRFQFPSGVKYTGPARVMRFEPVEVGIDTPQQVDVGLAWAAPITHAAA